MKDTIYRQDAIYAIYHHFPTVTMEGAYTVLHEVPSAEKTGKWVSQVGGGCYCSKCGRSALHDVGEKFTLLFTKSNYCPWCGAKMKGEDEG